jgi:hypothetical protein
LMRKEFAAHWRVRAENASPSGELNPRRLRNGKEVNASMDGRRNMLIGIVVAVLVVGALSYATGLTKLIRRSFGTSTEYKTSESAAAPELAAGEWINSAPLKLNDLRGRVVLIESSQG